MKRTELEFRNILQVLDPDFANFLLETDYALLEADGLTKINNFTFRRDYWSKPVDQVTINPNANLGNIGQKKSFCNLLSEMSAPLNKLSALALLRKYGNRRNFDGDRLVKSIIEGRLYFHNLTLFDLSYCVGLSLYPLLESGLDFFEGLKSNPPRRPSSFVTQVVRYIQYASNLFAGAIALTDFFPNYSYYTMMQESYSDKQRENDFQNLVHGLNDEVRISGQCFSGFTLVIIREDRSGRIFHVFMKSLMYIKDITQYSILVAGGFSRILNVKRSGEDYLYAIRLGNGATMKVSPDHPCFTKRGLVLAKSITLEDKMAVHVAEYRCKEDAGDYELGRFVGLYAADGGSEDKLNFSFDLAEPHLSKFVMDFATKRFCSRVAEHNRPLEHLRRVYIYDEGVKRLIKTFVAGNVWTKRLLSKCFSASKDFRLGLVDGYFEGDGGINPRSGTKHVESVSLRLIADINAIMQSLGILTYVARRNESRRRNCKKRGVITWLKNSPLSNTIRRFYSDKKDDNTYWVPIAHVYKTIAKHNIYDISIEKEDQLFKLPNGIIVHNSPFSNVSLGSPATLRGMLGNYLWGNSYLISHLMDEVMHNQKLYARFFGRGMMARDGKPLGVPYRFPITTLVADASFEKEYPDVWNEVIASNANLCYLNIVNNFNTDLKALSMCCRLTMNLEDMLKVNVNNTFGSYLTVGSHAVVSINLPRIAYEAKHDETRFMEILRERLEECRRLLLIHREDILENRRLKYNYFFRTGKISLKRNMFSTIGFIGFANAIEIMLNDEKTIISKTILNDSGLALAKKILTEMKAASVRFSREDGYMYNIEEVPGETASGALANKDRMLVGGDYEYYDTQFVPTSYDISIFDKIRVEGELQGMCTGGSIAHLNVEGIAADAVLTDMTKAILQKSKLTHFAMNKGFTVCKNSHTVQGIVPACPVCGASEVDWITRIVGYFVPVRAWNKTKQAEFNRRKWLKLEERVTFEQ